MLLIAVIQAACFTLIKAGLEFAPPLFFGGLRALFGGSALLALAVARRKPALPPPSTAVFLPLGEFQTILGRSDTNAFWLVSTTRDHTAIDRLSAKVEDTLAAAGYPTDTQIRYVEKNAYLATQRSVVGVLAVMGIPIIAIGLIGLVNMMTMNVLERTREIGVLRCIGARARDVRHIFQTEALAVALLGWTPAVPAGWLIGWTLVRVVADMFKEGALPYSYPSWYPPLSVARDARTRMAYRDCPDTTRDAPPA